MSGQATTKSGGVPLRAMTCGCEGQPLTALSHERTGDRTVHWARLLWVVAVRIFGEPARLPIGNQQDQSQAAPHSPITRDLRENQCLLKQDTDDRPTPRCCLPTGSPLPELRPRGLVEPGQPTWKHSACLCCRCLADARRCAFVLATEGGLFFNIHKHHKKTVSDQFFANTTFSFFLVIFGSRRGRAGG